MRSALLILGLLVLAGCGTPVTVTLIPPATNADNINTTDVQSGTTNAPALVGSIWQLMSTTDPAAKYAALSATNSFVTSFQSGGTGTLQSLSSAGLGASPMSFDWTSTSAAITTTYFTVTNGAVATVITSYHYTIGGGFLTMTDTATGYVYNYAPYASK